MDERSDIAKNAQPDVITVKQGISKHSSIYTGFTRQMENHITGSCNLRGCRCTLCYIKKKPFILPSVHLCWKIQVPITG